LDRTNLTMTRDNAAAMTQTVLGREGLAAAISHGFTAGTFDLSQRPGAELPGWEHLPEAVFAASLRGSGEQSPAIRTALTLVAAMVRARDATGLWRCAAALHAASRWALVPAELVDRSFTDLSDALRTSGVSQRHLPDAAAWRRIAESLVEEPESPVSRVITQGVGDAGELLAALRSSRSRAGSERFPYLAGPKVGPMWVRMMVFPGSAPVNGLAGLRVAVDVQVRRATENLGVTDTASVALDDARAAIEEAWSTRVRAEGADGAAELAGTCAALDPALWYFGRVGCGRCESTGQRMPIAPVCSLCRAGGWATLVSAPVMPPRPTGQDDRPLIGLVGCVKTKRPQAAPAEDLYVSPLFAGRRAAVEARAAQWFILSAEYGLLDPHQVIEPYDRVLASLPVALRREWSRVVVDVLRHRLGDLAQYRLEIHAGRSYFGFGLEAALRAAGAGVCIPTAGLAQGHQLHHHRATEPRAPAPATTGAAPPKCGYEAILGLLQRGHEEAITLSLEQIEEVMGHPLPNSAWRHVAWWHGSAQHRPAWVEAGWEPRVRLHDGVVEFVHRSPGDGR
jgi:hypothetical protein